jgi:hypothetical protein
MQVFIATGSVILELGSYLMQTMLLTKKNANVHISFLVQDEPLFRTFYTLRYVVLLPSILDTGLFFSKISAL